MATAIWPDDLPAFVQEQGFDESLPDTNVESQMDSGQQKARGRFTANWRPVSHAITCDLAQKKKFEHFYFETLGNGVLPFLWVNPITQVLAEFRFKRPPPRLTPKGEAIIISYSAWQKKQYAALRFDSTLITFDSTLVSFDETNRY